MSEDVMKLRSISVNFNFHIGDNYTLDFDIYRDLRDDRKGPEIEVILNEVEDNLSFEQMCLMAQTIGEETAKLCKINPDRYDITKRKLYDLE